MTSFPPLATVYVPGRGTDALLKQLRARFFDENGDAKKTPDSIDKGTVPVRLEAGSLQDVGSRKYQY